MHADIVVHVYKWLLSITASSQWNGIKQLHFGALAVNHNGVRLVVLEQVLHGPKGDLVLLRSRHPKHAISVVNYHMHWPVCEGVAGGRGRREWCTQKPLSLTTT